MKKVMIVDDEILVRIGIKSILNWEEHGYTIVAEAQNGAEALDKIKECRPDIILTDLMMEPVDGFELIKTCSREFPAVKFVVLSNYNDFDNVKKAMKLGVYDYIFKLTAKPEEILKIVNELSAAFDAEASGKENKAAADTKDENGKKGEMKSRLIESLIHQTYSSEEKMLDELESLGMAVDFQQQYAVLYISINDYFSVDFKENFIEINLLKYAMENIIHEVISKNNNAEVFNYYNGDLITVINPKGKNSDYQYLCNALSEDFEAFSEYIKRYLGVGITASLGPFYSGISSFSAAIKSNLQTLSRKLAEGDNKLYIYTNTRPEIIKIKKYIVDNLDSNLNVSIAARYINMSESYFSHIFKKEVGMSFVDYINKVRISRAAELLENTSFQVNQIAAQVGIDNANYFSVLFKKITGSSPYEFRNKIKEFK